MTAFFIFLEYNYFHIDHSFIMLSVCTSQIRVRSITLLFEDFKTISQK